MVGESGAACLWGGPLSLMPKSNLWADEMPAAFKIPVSGESGKLADGWLNTNYKAVATVSADTALGAEHSVVLVSAAATISLPTAVGIAGRVYKVIRTGSGAVTVAPAGTETINGTAAAVSLSAQWQSIELISDGAGWIRFDIAAP